MMCALRSAMVYSGKPMEQVENQWQQVGNQWQQVGNQWQQMEN